MYGALEDIESFEVNLNPVGCNSPQDLLSIILPSEMYLESALSRVCEISRGLVELRYIVTLLQNTFVLLSIKECCFFLILLFVSATFCWWKG